MPFLVLVSIFVNCVLHEKDCNLCGKLEEKTRRHLFQSTATTTWILLFINAILMIIFTAMELPKWNKSVFSPLFFEAKDHDDMYYRVVSRCMLSVVFIHRLVIFIPTCFLFVFFALTLCINDSIDANLVEEDEQQNKGKDSKYCSLTNISIAAMIFFAFALLWDFIPLIPHLIVSPYHTLSIIVQYICVLFLLHCLVYHFLKLCPCSECDNKSCRPNNHAKLRGKIENWCKKYDCKGENDLKKHCCCKCTCQCTWRTVCQILLTFFSLVFLAVLGFLYLIAVHMGVSTAAVTLSALSVVSAIAIATATDAVKCVYNKALEVLNCKEKDTKQSNSEQTRQGPPDPEQAQATGERPSTALEENP